MPLGIHTITNCFGLTYGLEISRKALGDSRKKVPITPETNCSTDF
jgi:hypothetical protein